MSMVSIIIINYNTFQLTCNCINSIIKYTNEVSYEIILVDNASVELQPGSFVDIFFDKIVFIKNKINVGFAGGNNIGLQYAKGEHILLLNSDTELFEDSISKSMVFLQKIANVGALSCKLLNPDMQSFQNAARPFFSLKNHFFKTMGFFKKSMSQTLKSTYNLNVSFACDWIWGTFFLFPKKNLAIMNGKLTETFFMYSEDVEWGYLFHLHGLQNYYYAETAIIHHIGKSNIPLQRKNNIRASHLKFLRIYHGNFVSFFERLLFCIDDTKFFLKRYSKKLHRKMWKQ